LIRKNNAIKAKGSKFNPNANHVNVLGLSFRLKEISAKTIPKAHTESTVNMIVKRQPKENVPHPPRIDDKKASFFCKIKPITSAAKKVAALSQFQTDRFVF
jgi:hypothetical protein